MYAHRHTVNDSSNTNTSNRYVEKYMNINFPFQFNRQGKTATANDINHIEQMIEQLLFTSPGERVNRSGFGGGLLHLVFEPNSDELSVTTQFIVQGGLQQWLGDLIEVNDVQVVNNDSTLQVTVVYTVRRTGESQVAQFSN